MNEISEISNVIEILYSMKEKMRMKIFEMVFSSGDNGISFKTIVKKGNIPPTTSAYHLKVLTNVGMIEKNFHNIDGRRDYSFYRSTPLGDRSYFMVNELYKNLRSEERIVEGTYLSDIRIIPLRYGPRCISVERLTG